MVKRKILMQYIPAAANPSGVINGYITKLHLAVLSLDVQWKAKVKVIMSTLTYSRFNNLWLRKKKK